MPSQPPAPKPETLPKELYVVLVNDGGGEPLFFADTDAQGFDDGAIVGIYELKATRTKRIKHSIE